MPWFAHRYRNRSAEIAIERAMRVKKRRDSWEHMKAQVAAKYQVNGEAR